MSLLSNEVFTVKLQLPIDTKVKPTPEQMKRAAVADRLFQAHNEINKIISAAAFQIIEGGTIAPILIIMANKIFREIKQAQLDAERL